MPRLITWLPITSDLPERFPSPFDECAPHPLARGAAEELIAELRAGAIPELERDGKMFGVLVVRAADGRVGFLKAFSGVLGGAWEREGFVPPLFDQARRAEVEVPGEAKVKTLLARARAFARSAEFQQVEAEWQALQARHANERDELRIRHATNRSLRHERRAASPDSLELQRLDQQSRADKAERRRQDAAHGEQRALVLTRRARMHRRLRAHERLRTAFCRRLMQALHDTYVVENARGEHVPLRSLYVDREPPSGAGDCAGAKLLGAARRLGVHPVALAEFWWGAPPATGGRLSGEFYAACKEKCGPLLPFMMDGLDVTPARRFASGRCATDPHILYEDEHLIVLEKPEGLLSVPGKEQAESVLTWLRARHANAFLAHRLDLDTSGVMVAAKDPRTYTELQRQFADRAVSKRYSAWLEGDVVGDEGTIDLAFRVDVNDRPRQIHDPVHGKRALTNWRVVQRSPGRTRVAFFPQTGRTHQLRVHAAHPLGLAAPIVGDRLYGRGGARLLLHAEAISFTHPASGERLSFERPAPF